jgi:UDP-N-acetylglucosamine 2-epimerase (non-hydrolysing)
LPRFLNVFTKRTKIQHPVSNIQHPMSNIKILVLFGTRPEVIKLAPLIQILQQETNFFITKVCDTGQHLELKQSMLDFFRIVPDYQLAGLQHSQTLADLTAYLLQELPAVLHDFQPDLLIVQGDTTTALAGSLAGFYHKINIAHVEAGLRTYQKWAPFPEEVNRKLITHLADLHFAPTEGAAEQLKKEGIKNETIHVVGNTVVDALQLALQQIAENEPITVGILKSKLLPLQQQYAKMILFTLHRRENLEQHLPEVGTALREVLQSEHCFALFPVHLNPAVQQWATALAKDLPNLMLTAPLPYEAFVSAMQQCDLILTDSGGIQEEAPTLGKPVVVLRTRTERPEAGTQGTVRQVSIDRQAIVNTARQLLQQVPPAVSTKNPFGDGKTAERIVEILKHHFSKE